MDIKTFYSNLEEIFEIDSEALTGEENLTDSGLLDSLSMLGLISFFDKKFNLQIEPADVLRVGTISDLYQLIRKQEKTTAKND